MDYLAWVVLCLPCDVPSTPAMRAFAARCELCDENETYLSAADLARRWQELRHAPSVMELVRFPPFDTARHGFQLAAARAEWCRVNRVWHSERWHAWTMMIEAAAFDMRCWNALDTAANTSHGIVTRRRAAAELRTLLGPRAWAAGVMP